MTSAAVLSALRSVLREYPALYPLLPTDTRKAIFSNYPVLRAEFFATVYDAVEGYLMSSRPFTGFRNAMARIISTGFLEAAEIGYEQAGAILPFDADTQAWLATRIDQEIGFVQDLFMRLSGEKQEANAVQEAYSRATGYSNTLDAVYGEAKLRGAENITLIFLGDDGAESCPECKALKGKKRKVKWIIANDMFPRPGNEHYTCKGYRCRHYWANPITGIRYDGRI